MAQTDTFHPKPWPDKAIIFAFAALYCLNFSSQNLIDLDVWHQMAIFREFAETGAIPHKDPFSYTPVKPVFVHHEWGAGAMLYGLSMILGGNGILYLKYFLVFLIAAFTILSWRKHRIPMVVGLFCIPVIVLMAGYGLSPTRPQIMTFALVSGLLYSLAADRAGGRNWKWIWVPAFIFWINVHAGFVVGLGFVFLYWLETVILHKRVRADIPAYLLLIVLLVCVNPYGFDYYEYLFHAIAMERPDISEWEPIWRMESAGVQAVYYFSLYLLAYAALRRGTLRFDGFLITAVSALAAMTSNRHVPIYAIAWAFYVPPLLMGTRLHGMLDTLYSRFRLVILPALCVFSAYLALNITRNQSWRMMVPGHPIGRDHNYIVFPVGPVEYLGRNRLRGNVMTDYDMGSYVMWKLHPEVKVSLDSRYEAAYPAWLFEESKDFYLGRDGWEAVLGKYPHDFILVRKVLPVSGLLKERTDWRAVYEDDCFELYGKTASNYPYENRSGEEIWGAAP